MLYLDGVGHVDDAGGLLLREVVDEALLQLAALVHDLHGLLAVRHGHQHAELLLLLQHKQRLTTPLWLSAFFLFLKVTLSIHYIQVTPLAIQLLSKILFLIFVYTHVFYPIHLLSLLNEVLILFNYPGLVYIFTHTALDFRVSII